MENQYKCKYCQFSTNNRNNITQHRRKEHQKSTKINLPNGKELNFKRNSNHKNFVCHCNKLYSGIQSLRRHVLSCEVIKIRYLTNSNELRETNSTYTYSSSNDSNSEIEAGNETENYINNNQINSNDILSKFNNFINSSQNSNNENDDNRIINPFFIKSKWNLLLESFANKKELYNLVQINTEKEDFHNLYLMISLYKEHVFNLINENEDFTLMRWLINERGSISTLPTKGFKDLQEESSVEKYIKLIQKIILGLYQVSSNLCNGIIIELDPSIVFELNLLKQNSR
jgi:hypothetical protein